MKGSRVAPIHRLCALCLEPRAAGLQGASRHFTYDWTFTPGVLMEPGSLVMVILAPWLELLFNTPPNAPPMGSMALQSEARNGPWPLVQSPL